MEKAIFFDFWGTLWNPNIEDPSLDEVAKEAFQLGLVKTPEDAKLKARRWGGFPFPGVCSIVIQTAKICPQFIVSHSDGKVMMDILADWLLLPLFKSTLGLQDSKYSKLDLVKTLCTKHDVEPLLYIGDSFEDVQLGKQLGCFYIHLGKRSDFIDVLGKETKKQRIFSTFFLSLQYMTAIFDVLIKATNPLVKNENPPPISK